MTIPYQDFGEVSKHTACRWSGSRSYGIEQTGSQLSINVPDLDQGLPLDIEHSESLTNK